MSLIKNLKQFGLEEKEAKVYLAALELGPVSIQNITKKSNIKRSTVYEMIKNLKSSGLMSESCIGKRKIYIASEPERLKKNIREKERLLDSILPELQSFNNVKNEKPKITYYEGREGLRKIFNLALETITKKVDWISPIKPIIETVGERFLEEHIEKRAKEKYWVRSIQITDQQVDTYKYLNPITFDKTYRRVKFAPPGMDIPNVFGIWDNKVAILGTRKEGFGIIIESRDLVRTMRTFYDLLWGVSKTWGELFNDKVR